MTRKQMKWTTSHWRVRKTLDRNRNLLKAWRTNQNEVNDAQVAEESVAWLVRRGFDFDYHTHLHPLKDGKLAVMCFDEGYVVDGARLIPWKPQEDHPRRLRP
ncbi:MAG: hypothetical protein RLZZ314_952 [Bacteroidota bacterium]|jgi:hypothetical protein